MMTIQLPERCYCADVVSIQKVNVGYGLSHTLPDFDSNPDSRLISQGFSNVLKTHSLQIFVLMLFPSIETAPYLKPLPCKFSKLTIEGVGNKETSDQTGLDGHVLWGAHCQFLAPPTLGM